MRSEKQRERQRKKRGERNAKRKQDKTAKRLERAERKLSKAIQRVRAKEQRGDLHLRRYLTRLSGGTLQQDKLGRILSTTTGSVQGPVPVRASI